MTEIISVRFRGGCKNYDFDPRGAQFKMGDQVIVETAQGLEFATCTEGNHEVDESRLGRGLSTVVRMATENDLRTVEYNKKREGEAFDICERKIAEHALEMKLVNVSCCFDGSKILFFFTADGRVDFRELVRDLASVFRARIELRQIGVRDEAKMIGGLGICGRPFCCSQFLEGFMPVSIKMAKTQNLSLNPTKISGTCGRLMCCLKYEQNAYEDAVKRMPKQDSFVQTPDGPGNVKSVDLLRERVKVSLDSGPLSDPPKCYHNCEVCVLRNGKGSRDGIEIPTERPTRFVPEPPAEDEEDTSTHSPLSTPFYMSHLEEIAEAAENAPVREKIGGAEGAEKRRRRRGRGRGHTVGADTPHSGAGSPASAAPRPPKGAPSMPLPPRVGQAGPSTAQKPPQPPHAAETPGAAGGESKRRRPHHRGGRRRHGEGASGAEPKGE